MEDMNPFDAFLEDDSGALAVGTPPEAENPFSQFASEPAEKPFAAAPKAKAEPRSELESFPGFSVVTEDPTLQDAFSRLESSHKKKGTDAVNELRGNGFIDGLIDPQQYGELAKGVIPGAVGMVGSTLKGASTAPAIAQYNAAAFGRKQLTVFDRIDRGEAVPDMEDPVGYQHMTAEQRATARADVERASSAFNPTPLSQRPLFRAGQSVTQFGRDLMPAAPGYEESIGRQLGEGLGSMFAGLPVGMAGGSGAGAIFFGAAGAGEATERALEFDRKENAAGRPGLSQEQIAMAAVAGIAPGATDLLPVELLLGRLKVPPQLQRVFARAIARKGGEAFVRVATQAAVEGGQEGFQQTLQNLIAKEIYNPEQSVTDGVLPSSGVGAGVGGI